MADIVKECRNIPGLEDEIFPPYVGGGPVKLLIGIGDPLLEPERIFTLPTGLAIYRSAIKDIWGSYMCIGGPHPSFSNSKLKEANMITAMLIREVDQFRQSIYGNSNIRLSYQGSDELSHNIVYSLPADPIGLVGPVGPVDPVDPPLESGELPSPSLQSKELLGSSLENGELFCSEKIFPRIVYSLPVDPVVPDSLGSLMEPGVLVYPSQEMWNFSVDFTNSPGSATELNTCSMVPLVDPEGSVGPADPVGSVELVGPVDPMDPIDPVESVDSAVFYLSIATMYQILCFALLLLVVKNAIIYIIMNFTLLYIAVKNASTFARLQSYPFCQPRTVVHDSTCDVCAVALALDGRMKNHSKETIETLSRATIFLVLYFTLLYEVVKDASVSIFLLQSLLLQLCACVSCSTCDICCVNIGSNQYLGNHSKETTHTLSGLFWLSTQMYGSTLDLMSILEILYTASISFLFYFAFLRVVVKNASIFVYLPSFPTRQYVHKGHAPSTLESLYNAIIFCLYFTLLYVVVKNASFFISSLQQLCVCAFCSSCDICGANSSQSKYLKKHCEKMSHILSELFYLSTQISIFAMNTISLLETVYATSISFSIYFTLLCVVVKNASFCVYLTSLLLCEFSAVLCSTNCDVCADVSAMNGCLKKHSKETLCVLSRLFYLPTHPSTSKPIFLEMQALINFDCLNLIGRKFFYTPMDDVSHILSNENIIFYGIFTEKTILLENYSLLYEWIVDIIHNHSKCLHCSYYSWMSRRRAEEDAERLMKDGRRTYVQPGDDNTVPAPPTHQWGSRVSFNKEKLCSLVTGVPPNPSRRIGRDRAEMDRFLDAVRKYEGEVPVITGAQEEAFFASVPFPAATLKTLSFARSDLATVDWRIPDEEARLGLVLHSDLEGTVVELDPENLLQQEFVFTLTRLVTVRPMRERLQEWIWLRPEQWRQLVRLMELRPQYVPVFQEIYEHLRLTYLRATGRFDGTIASIEDDILERNIVMQRTLENAVEVAEAELRMRQRRLAEFHALKDQGVYINRKGWQHVITPTTSRPVNYIPRDRPMNVPKRKRVRGEETRVNKRPRLDLLEEIRKQAILAPTTINRPDVDPEVPLERGEHHSCEKVGGAPTAQRMASKALAEHRYRLVVYMFTDEDDGDSHIILGPAPNVIKEGKMGTGFTAVRGRIVCLDDNTMVTMSDPVDPSVPG